MKDEFSGHIFEKYSNTKFHWNPSRRSRVVLAYRRRDVTKLRVVFRNFGSAPTKQIRHITLTSFVRKCCKLLICTGTLMETPELVFRCVLSNSWRRGDVMWAQWESTALWVAVFRIPSYHRAWSQSTCCGYQRNPWTWRKKSIEKSNFCTDANLLLSTDLL